MKNRIYLGLVLILSIFISCKNQQTKSKTSDERPNIVLILADDMGYSDLGFFGSQIETPNLDKLAGEGVVFNQFYNAGRCCPTRASLLTGLYKHQTGVGDMVKDFGHPSYQGYLNQNCKTIAELLGSQGYQTMMAGKWHLGDKPEHWPTKRGFENFYGIPEGGGVYFYPFPKPRNVVWNDKIITPDSTYYTTYAFNEYAVKFVAQAKNDKRPFFLYLPHIAPHFPLQAPKHEIEKYRGIFKSDFENFRNQRLSVLQQKKLIKEKWPLSPAGDLVDHWDNLTEEQQDEYDLKMAIYAAQMNIMDRGIGDLVETLKETGQLDNTIIFFLSDNGGTSERTGHRYPELNGLIGTPESYETYGASWANVSNTPFRYYKSYLYEGGISTPLIAYAPGKFGKHRIQHASAHIIDIVPTILELTSTKYTQDESILPLEGESLVPFLKDSTSANKTWENQRTFFWEHEGDRAVRKGDWKLVSTYPENIWRLYNMASDRTELFDKKDEFPEIAKDLENTFFDWAKKKNVLPWEKVLEFKKEHKKKKMK